MLCLHTYEVSKYNNKAVRVPPELLLSIIIYTTSKTYL